MNNKGGKQTKTFLKTYLKNSWNELQRVMNRKKRNNYKIKETNFFTFRIVEQKGIKYIIWGKTNERMKKQWMNVHIYK